MKDYSKTHVIRSADDPSLFVGRVSLNSPYALLSWRWAYCDDADESGRDRQEGIAASLPAGEFGTLEVVLTDLHGNEVA